MTDEILKNFYQGDTIDFSFTVFDQDENPISVDGAVIALTVKHLYDNNGDDSRAVLKKRVIGVEPVVGVASGRIVMGLNQSDTSLLAGKYKYDIKLKYMLEGESKVGTLENGILIIKPSITKDW